MRLDRIALAGACLLATAALVTPAAAQCDGITWTFADPVLTITHDATYNCAVFRISHEVRLEGATLLVQEHAIASGWADCMCPYATEVQIVGLPAGDYTLRVEYGEQVGDEPPGWWTWCELPLTIPDTGRDDPIELLVNESARGCGMLTVVPEVFPDVPAAWGSIKARYR